MSISYKITDKKSYNRAIDKIHALNTIDFVEFDGFKIGSFLAVSYYEIFDNGMQLGNKQKIKNIIRCFIRDYTYNFNQNFNDTVLLFYSHEHARREDHVRIMNDVNKMIPYSKCFTGNDSSRKISINKQSFYNLGLLKKWNNQLKPVEDNSKIRAFLVSKLSLAFRWKQIICNNIDYLKKINGLITLFDAREYENILTQVCESIGVKSATIEHGYFPSPFFESEENYYLGMPFLGFVSTEFWAWGDIVKDNGKKAGLTDDEIKAVGYPKILHTHDYQKVSSVIGIILDGGMFSIDTNHQMIKIAFKFAKQNGYKIIIKPHPHDFTDYVNNTKLPINDLIIEINRDSIENYATKVSFSICFNSSAYIDLLAMKARVFRYKDPSRRNLFYFLSDDDCFNCVEALIAIAKNVERDINSNNRTILIGDVTNVSEQYSNNAERLFMKEGKL